MTLFGCCLPFGSFVPQIENNEKQVPEKSNEIINGLAMLKTIGFDFGELTAGAIADLSCDDMKSLSELLDKGSYCVPVFNSFIPPKLPLTGLYVNKDAVIQYVDMLMSRIHRLKGKLIIFGSGGARRIPEGFPRSKGMDQLNDFFVLCNECAGRYQLTVAIEPLNKKECNVINTVKEGLDIVKSLHLPNIKLLADTYHMNEENEPFDILKQAAEHLVHIHLSDQRRLFPGSDRKGGVDFIHLSKILKDSSYKGRLSFECNDHIENKSGQALKYIKGIWEECMAS